MNLKAASISPVKAPVKRSAVQSRPPKKKVTRMLGSESSKSIEDEEARTTPGLELASSVLSAEQNKIPRDIIHRKVVWKGKVFNLPITHIHRPPLDENTGCFHLEIREPHKLHV